MQKIKLCRITYEFAPLIGGSIIHTIELAKHIAPYCERQFFIVPESAEDTIELDAGFPFEIYRVKYFKFSILRVLKSRYIRWLPVAPLIHFSFGLAAIKKCLWLNKKYGLDIIHAHGIGMGPVATVLKFMIKKPAVLMIDGSLESYSRLSGIYESIMFKTIFLDHYFIVDNGGPVLRKFQNLIKNRKKMTPVYINIDVRRVCPKPKNRELSIKYTLENKFVYISVHNLEPVQGIEYSIKAFKKLLDISGINDAVLLVVGDGSVRAKLERLVKDLHVNERVIFTGAINNSLIPEYYSLADVALSTSTKVNMNTSMVEAMACGKPVISFDCGNTSDRLIQDMETGVFAKITDITDVAKKMILLANDSGLREKIGTNARKFILEYRSWEKRIKVELNVYQDLLNRVTPKNQ